MDSSLLAATGACATASTATDTSGATAGDLLATIKSQLDKGTSLETIVGKLADSLAAQVAAMLGISSEAARAQLTSVFTKALSTTGPPGTTNAQRASALATRFRQIADLATRVTDAAETGTPIRSIAGQRSDADTAKADPTPTPGSQTDGLVQSAIVALTATSPVPVTTPSVPSAPAAVTAAAAQGDGRTVALPKNASPRATGGDTLLGRTLARALLANDQRSAPAAASPDATRSDASGTANAQSAAGMKAPAALETYVHAFVTALAQSDGGGAFVPQHAAAGADAASLPQNVSFAIPVAHDAAPITPPAPAATLPQPQQVDANAVIDQVLRGMQVGTGDGTSTVRLRLVPEQLGELSVKLVVSGGSVDATLTAHTVDAQSALAGAQTQLAKSLADAGLKLQSFSVGLAGGGFAGTGDQANRDASSRQNSRKTGAAPVAGTTGETDDPHSLLAIPSFGPPLYTASPDLGALNYLV